MTSDNQCVKIGIRVLTSTMTGLSWEGQAEISGPPNDEMISEAMRLGDKLVEEAFRQQGRQLPPADSYGADNNGVARRYDDVDLPPFDVPSRPKRTRRTKAQIEADMLAAQEMAKYTEGMEEETSQEQQSSSNDPPYDLPFPPYYVINDTDPDDSADTEPEPDDADSDLPF